MVRVDTLLSFLLHAYNNLTYVTCDVNSCFLIFVLIFHLMQSDNMDSKYLTSSAPKQLAQNLNLLSDQMYYLLIFSLHLNGKAVILPQK